MQVKEGEACCPPLAWTWGSRSSVGEAESWSPSLAISRLSDSSRSSERVTVWFLASSLLIHKYMQCLLPCLISNGSCSSSSSSMVACTWRLSLWCMLLVTLLVRCWRSSMITSIRPKMSESHLGENPLPRADEASRTIFFFLFFPFLNTEVKTRGRSITLYEEFRGGRRNAGTLTSMAKWKLAFVNLSPASN